MDENSSTRLSPARLLAAQVAAEVAGLIDLQLSPLGTRAIEALSPQRGDVVLDVGCGAGQTVLQLAERVGPTGRVIAIDIVPLILDMARRRAAGVTHVQFIEADAQTLDLDSDSADGVFSRFGVMAFTDPVAAFANFRRILRRSGKLAFVCWRALEENELDFLPLRAAGLEQRVDNTPFSFSEPARLRAILAAAGFEQIGIEAHDQMVSSGNVDGMAMVLLRVGALGRILRENPELRAEAEPRVRAALSERLDRDRVALKAATWIVTARA